LEIAPGIDASEWTKLDLSRTDSSDWKRAIEILRTRIEARYLGPVDRLIEDEENLPPWKRRYGFIVLAIDCLLIETLESFIEGKIDTKKSSRQMFINFLTSREHFKTDFGKGLAIRFYKQVRCGILHQAETRKCLLRVIGPLVQYRGEQMILNRAAFHSRLKLEFEAYLNDIAEGTDPVLCSNLKEKMNHICTN